MHTARLLLLGLAAAVSAIALTTAPASAKINFDWFVGGSLLKTGEQKTVTVNTDGHVFDFHSSVAGASVLLLSNKLNVEKGLIEGGRPGGGEVTLLLENVTVDQPKGCLVESVPSPAEGTIKTKILQTEIVEGAGGETLLLYVPKSESEYIATLLFLKNGAETCAVAGAQAELLGSFLGSPLPQKAEALREAVDFPAKESLFLTASCPLAKAGLRFAGEAATLTGLTLVVLTSDAVYGPF